MVVADMKTSETDVDVTEKDMEVVYCGESIQKTEEVYRLPDNKADYMRMTVAVLLIHDTSNSNAVSV